MKEDKIKKRLDEIPDKYFPPKKVYRLTISLDQIRHVVGHFKSLEKVDRKIQYLGCPNYFIEEITLT